MSFEDFNEFVMPYIEAYAFPLLLAVLTLIVGLIIIRKVVKVAASVMEKKEVDESLRLFLRTLMSFSLKAMLYISVIGMVGIQTTSFIAVLGAAGLAVGMALSGTLQNFAGGVVILVLKPFKKGDYIDAQGHSGTVTEIQIFHTILLTPDNKTIVLANGPLSTGSVVNYSAQPTRRVDWVFGIGYGDKTDEAKVVLDGLVNNDERILKDPEHFIAVSELADNSVNLVVKAWVKKEDYWNVFYDMNNKVYNAFNEKGLNIPFPQMDVHLHQSPE